ncbi:hypothetical protein [Pannonibacter tanglangensis]|uniref:hypothetical protein n=1 Tax=Pannonibacter tanglangensis TaxID=2750084 RepID=UPI001AD8C308|nr:hypothetical protein [Pannonibacter sp. XCT-53]
MSSVSSPPEPVPADGDIGAASLAGGLDPALRGSLWRHRKTQGVYRIVGRCRIEASGLHAFLYQGQDGTIWARPVDEFLDGRFERLTGEQDA